MKNVRRRFTIPEELLAEAEEYAQLDHRTFSKLVCETLQQHMRRYPKARKNGLTTGLKALEDRIIRLEGVVAGRVPAGTQGEGSKEFTDDEEAKNR